MNEQDQAKEQQVEATEQQMKFISLRAQGWTFARIAAELNVSKRTLINWSHKFQFEIKNLRALELEAIQAEYVATREERIRQMGEQLRAVVAELKTRDITEMSTARLFALAASLRREILKAGDPELTLSMSTRDIPHEEYHEQVQDWRS